MQIILASASPRRKELMKLITENFTAEAVEAEEIIPSEIAAENASEYLSKIKAEAASKLHSTDLVIGCDTTVLCDGKILGKPADKEECRKYMNLLSGCAHIVATGCTIRYGAIEKSFTVYTEVFFREMDPEEIEYYISTDEPYDKAGGYGIQGKASIFIDKINGDYFNVVGLPVSRLNTELKSFLNNINKGEIL